MDAQNPIVAGRTATLLWRGRRPPVLEGDFTGWDPGAAIELQRVEPGLWMHRLTLTRETYMEYAFTRDGEHEADRLNPRLTWNGISAYNNFFYMPAGAPSGLATRRRDAPAGTVTRHVLESMFWRESRIVMLYRPPVRERVPLVVVYDGRDYYRRARLPTIIDNLIAARRIRPVAVAFVPSVADRRFIEYGCSDITVAFVMNEVVPLAQRELDLVDVRRERGAYGVAGASMGGLMALYTGLRQPDTFGHVLGQSSALQSAVDFVVWDLARAAKRLPKIWLSPGKYELPGVLEANRKMRGMLRARHADFAYREADSGHNYPSWRDDVYRGLEWLYPPTRSARRSGAPAGRRTATRRSSRGSRR